MSYTRQAKHASHRALEAAEIRLIFGASFTVFLLGAMMSRLTPWRSRGGDAGRKHSVFAQARAATDRTIPFAFMS